jgi:nicotinamidase-related amidase
MTSSLSRARAVLAVIDVQERLLPAIPEERRTQVLRNVLIAIDAATILGLPTVASEQYPKGLGPTVPEVREHLGDTCTPVEKLVFSCGRSPEFRAALEATGRRDVILCGVEAHVCVLQTTLDLLGNGYRVFVPADAVASRRLLDWERGLALMERAGAVVGTTEIFVFQLLERAGTDEFRAISKLVR